MGNSSVSFTQRAACVRNLFIFKISTMRRGDQKLRTEMDNAEKQTAKIGAGKPGPGRPKGIPNKTNALLKDAILLAAQSAGGGGDDGLVNYLTEQAKENPGPFLALIGKVLPMQVTGADGGALQISVVKFGADNNSG